MKKIIGIIIAVTICLSAFVPAFADLGEPFFYGYDAVMTKEDGYTFEYDDEDITIPYGEKVLVTGEYDDYETGQALYRITYKDAYGEIPAAYLRKTTDAVGKEEAEYDETPLSFIVLNKDGAPVRKGPADSYEQTGILPQGTIIKAEYFVGFPSWVYVETKGVTGWTDVDQLYGGTDYATMTEGSIYTGEILVVDDTVKLYSDPDGMWTDEDNPRDEPVKTVDVPAGTVLTFDYFYNHPKYISAHVKYKGFEGWLIADEFDSGDNNQSVATGVIHKVMPMEDGIEIYTGPFNTGKATGVVVPPKTVLESDMFVFRSYRLSDGTWYEDFTDFDYEDANYVGSHRINYNGTKGWITNDFQKRNTIVYNTYEDTFCCRDDVELLADVGSSEVAGVIPAGTVFTTLFDADEGEDWYHYVQCGDKSGWILESDNNPITWVNPQVYRAQSEMTIYSKTEKQGEILGTIPNGEEFESDYSFSFDHGDENNSDYYRNYHIYYGEIEGWVVVHEDEDVSPLYIRDGKLYSEKQNDTEETEATQEDIEKASSSAKSIVIICIAAAAVAAVIAGIAIIILSKKKKSGGSV